jgi:hypothetical protein
MKKTLLLLIVLSLAFSSSAFALTIDPWADGTSLNANSSAASLSPNVELSYDSDDGTNYALTGANLKGAMCYGVESGNQGVYQQAVIVGAGPVPAADDNAPATDQYAADDKWSPVGK